MPTTNPVPSNDPIDLLFNAQKLDQVVNGSDQYYTDRLGVNRRTVEGISAAADAVLGGLGYAPPVAYAAGISLTLTTQTVEYAGEVYAPKVADLPFTTGGTFETAKFRLIQGVAATDLAASGGAGMIGYDGGTVQGVLDDAKAMWDYDALRAYTGRATGVRIKKPGLSGFFQRRGTVGLSDNKGTVIIDAAGRAWERVYEGPAYATWFGAVGNGEVDDTLELQAFVDAMKGKTAVFNAGHTFLFTFLNLSDSTYNNTKLVFDGWLKMKGDGTGNNPFVSAHVGLLLKGCDGIWLNPKIDGNRADMAQSEFIYGVGIAGATNITMPTADFKEIRGDGIYIDQLTWGTNSANPKNIKIGTVNGYNTSDDGRNLVSVIAVSNLTIGEINSYQIGGVVDGVLMPGGFDIEPNFGYQTCENIVIGTINVVSAGTSGVAIAGKAVTSNATEDWCVHDVVIGAVNVKMTTAAGWPFFQRCTDVVINGINVNRAQRSFGISFDFCNRVKARGKVSNVTAGLLAGYAGFVRNSDIDFDVFNYSIAGVNTVGVSSTRIKGKVSGPASSTGTFGIYTIGRAGATQSAVTYSIDMPYDGAELAVYNDATKPATYANGTCVRDCNWSGWPSFTKQNSNAALRSHNVIGRNLENGLIAAPSTGYWVTGDVVEFDQTVGGTPPSAQCIAYGLPGTWKTRPVIAA